MASVTQRILEELDRRGLPIVGKEDLVERLELNPNGARGRLSQMTQAGWVARSSRGYRITGDGIRHLRTISR